jgi:protein TonB
MFEDSLVESTGRIRTRSSRYAAGSFVLETALVAVIILIPYLYPAALPRKFLAVPLIAPPPVPAASVAQQPAASASRPRPLTIDMAIPTVIPRGPVQITDTPPGPIVPATGSLGDPSNGAIGALPLGLSTPPPVIPVHPARPTSPIHVSSGVAAGQLIVPIQPHYPAIASPPAPREPSLSPLPSPLTATSRASASSAARPCSSMRPLKPSAKPATAPGNSMASPSKSKPPST